MREIKFRLFYENEMFYSDNEHENFDQPKREWIPFLFRFGSSSYNTEKFSELMQFTGLQDVTGNDIYEGDIVLHGALPGAKNGLPIVFENCKFTIKSKIESDNINLGSNGRSIKVIGNIYENPELLEASE